MQLHTLAGMNLTHSPSPLRIGAKLFSEAIMSKTGTKTLTQALMAKLYLNEHSLDTLYTRRQWYRWNGKVWEKFPEPLLERELKPYLRVGYTYGVLSQVKNLVQIDAYAADDTMDNNRELINLDNGIYDLRKDLLYKHHSDYHITTILPFGYDPEATCPAWEAYLRSTFVLDNGSYDGEMAGLVQEAIGYSLTTDVRHHVMFWCYGDGANGKGTMFYVIKQLLGSGCMELNVNGLQQNHYQLASLAGKRVATSAEVKGADKLAEDAMVMAVVAGDPIQVRMINEKPFETIPTAKLWWSMNTLPPIDETSEGVWRRIRIIPFTRKFKDSEKILDLKDRLQCELPGIFNWALEGLKRVQRNNAISIPRRAAEVKAEYQRESNIVQVFVEDMCDRGADLKVSRPAFYRAFKQWSVDNGHRIKSSTRVGQELKRLGIHSRKTMGEYVYDTIALTTEGQLL